MRPASTLLLALLLLATSACQGSARGRRTLRDDAGPVVRADDAGRGGAPARPASGEAAVGEAPRVDPLRIPGTPSIRIVWEALYVEREQVLTPKKGRVGAQGIAGIPDLEVALVNSSFEGTPEQIEDNRARRKQGGLTRVGDQDVLDLLAVIRDAGFYAHAKPTGALEPLFGSERSRGRITIEEGGRSVTLLSQRGLGLAESTREIPGIYAEVKRAIQVLRNRCRTFELTRAHVSGTAPTSAAKAAEPPPTRAPKPLAPPPPSSTPR